MTVNKNVLDVACKALLKKAELPADPTIPYRLQLVQWALDPNAHPAWTPPIPDDLMWRVLEQAQIANEVKPETVLRLLATDVEEKEPLQPALRRMTAVLPNDPQAATSRLAETFWMNLQVFNPALQAHPNVGN